MLPLRLGLEGGGGGGGMVGGSSLSLPVQSHRNGCVEEKNDRAKERERETSASGQC